VVAVALSDVNGESGCRATASGHRAVLPPSRVGLSVYHVLEDAFRSQIDVDVSEDQIGVMAAVLDAEEIAAAVRGMRERGTGRE
jgi:hypothetical protein